MDIKRGVIGTEEVSKRERSIRPKSILFVKSILIIDELSIMEYKIAKHIFSVLFFASIC